MPRKSEPENENPRVMEPAEPEPEAAADSADDIADPTKFARAPEIYASYVVPLVNDHRSDLAQARIVTMFRAGTWKSAGLTVLAKTTKVTAQTKALIGEPEPDYVITVSADVWGLIGESARMALIDHELAHCFVDEDSQGNPKYALVGHDIEEFFSIIRRHGDWSESIKRALRAYEESKQVTMFDMAAERDARKDAARDSEYAETFPEAVTV